MPLDYEQALLNFRAISLIEQVAQSRNEATTRFQLIDRILREALGWELGDCTLEESHDGEYADYVLGNPRRLAIWEAKREGLHFTLPVGLDKPICKIATLRASDVNLQKAIDQVLGYCQKRGIGLAVVCNGHQLVAFLPSRHDGIPPLEGNALCFMSHQQIDEQFRMFWDNLSKLGVESSYIYKTLRADGTPLPPPKLASRIHPYPGLKFRNDLQVSLKNLGELFLFDLATLQIRKKTFYNTATHQPVRYHNSHW